MSVRWTGRLCLLAAWLHSTAGCDAPSRPTETSALPSRTLHTHQHRPAPAADMPLASASLFQLEVELHDQSGQVFSFVEHRGHPTLVTFFYSSCETMCPLIISDLRRIESALPPAVRSLLRVVLVSIDSERDSIERLAQVARERHIDVSRWSLVRGSEADVRAIAATLGMTYRRTSDNEFAHGALLSLLDQEGVLALQTDGAGRDEAPMARAIEELVNRPQPRQAHAAEPTRQ